MRETLTSLIPAGGDGTRLRPHTLRDVKPMLLMGAANQRIIDFALDLSAEVDHTLVTTHHEAERAEKVEAYAMQREGIRILRDKRKVGAAALLDHYEIFAQEHPYGDMIVLPADLVQEGLTVSDFHAYHRDKGKEVTLLAIAPKKYGEYVEVKDGLAKNIYPNLRPGSVSTTGIYILRNEYLLQWMKKELERGWNGEERSMYKDIICPAVQSGKAAVYLMPEQSHWDDAGTLTRYHQNNMRLSRGANVVSPNAYIHSGTTFENCVILGSPTLAEGVSLKNAIISGEGDKIDISVITYE